MGNACRGGRGRTAPLIINRGTGVGEWAAAGSKNTRYPLNGRLGGTHSQRGRFGEERSPLVLLGIEPRIV